MRHNWSQAAPESRRRRTFVWLSVLGPELKYNLANGRQLTAGGPLRWRGRDPERVQFAMHACCPREPCQFCGSATAAVTATATSPPACHDAAWATRNRPSNDRLSSKTHTSLAHKHAPIAARHDEIHRHYGGRQQQSNSHRGVASGSTSDGSSAGRSAGPFCPSPLTSVNRAPICHCTADQSSDIAIVNWWTG